MRWLILWAATVVTAFGQGGNFSGTAFDLDTGRTQVISGNVSDPNQAHRERMANYDRSIAETSASINAMRQEGEMQQQTCELRKQTELLRNMSKEGSGGSSSSYVPLTSSVPQESKEERAARQKIFLDDEYIRATGLAQKAKSFDAKTKKPLARQLSSEEGSDYENCDVPNNSDFIKSLLQIYGGHFTDYKWTVEKVDKQTYLAKCQVTLDGEQNDFRFRVNPLVGTCRYEGGTALGKLAPPKAKRTITFLDEEE